MLSQEWQFKHDYSTLITTFQAAFPHIAPPDYQWFFHWLEKYSVLMIKEAIETLGKHRQKDRFTPDSTGKAISAILRQEALKRAIASVQTPGGAQ
jgi:hypothetical protein